MVSLACIITLWCAPPAKGSGVAEVMGMLNGVNYQGIISFNTFWVKFVGTLFAVVGGLAIGKEGPLVHMGAIIGVICCYSPWKLSDHMQNDYRKRQMIASGAACGLSVAFGAPIGGTLFAYEISTPNTFWTFTMLWRVFVSTSIATFTLGVLTSLLEGEPLTFSDSGAIKFGSMASSSENSLLDLPASIVLGILSGFLGSIFVKVNVWCNVFRG